LRFGGDHRDERIQGEPATAWHGGARDGVSGHLRLTGTREASPYDTSAYILLYVALFGAFGVASPFWPMLFDSRGLTTQEISWALAAGMVFRLVAGPLIGRLADATASPPGWCSASRSS
jgi:VIT1/CCC1 family predicted Fe2+/Mn2+ transporter